MRVISLHSLPFDPDAFEREMESLKDHAPKVQKELRQQYRQNWDNAWLVVVEWDGSAESVDFGMFSHGAAANSDDRQAPWLEQVIEEHPDRTRAAFFLHYVDRKTPLFYGDEALTFPAPSPADPALIKQMDYVSPD